MLKLPKISIPKSGIICSHSVSSFNKIYTRAPLIGRTFQTTSILHRKAVRLQNEGPLPLRVIHPTQAEIMKLNNLQDNPGSKFQKRRLGRGWRSRKGRLGGRGSKGQKSRSGSGPHVLFSGGQTQLWMRFRKFAYKNKVRNLYVNLSLARLERWILDGRIDPSKKITMKTIVDSGCIRRVKYGTQMGIKLIAKGKSTFDIPIDIEISQASSLARALVESAGGSLKTMYYNKLGLRYLLKPHKYRVAPKRALAPPTLRKFYDDWGADMNLLKTLLKERDARIAAGENIKAVEYELSARWREQRTKARRNFNNHIPFDPKMLAPLYVQPPPSTTQQ